MKDTENTGNKRQKASFDVFSFHYFDTSVYFSVEVDTGEGTVSICCQGTTFGWGIPEYTWEFPLDDVDVGFFEAIISKSPLDRLTAGEQGEKGWDLSVSAGGKDLYASGTEVFSQEFLNYLRYIAMEKMKTISIDFEEVESIGVTDSSLRRTRSAIVEKDGSIELVSNKKRMSVEDSEEVSVRWGEFIDCLSGVPFLLSDLKRGADFGVSCTVSVFLEGKSTTMVYEGCKPDGWIEFADRFFDLASELVH